MSFHEMKAKAAMPSFLGNSDSCKNDEKRSKSLRGSGGGFFRMLRHLPALSSGCKMAALLSRSAAGKAGLLADHAATVTLFGHRKSRISLAIHEDTRSPPVFLIELPILTSSLHKEMASGVVRLALESDTKSQRKKLMEEYVWAVFCNGRKSGYSIRRKLPNASDDERQVMLLLHGVSMGAGVMSCGSEREDGEMTYMRARFDQVVGSKDSIALHMINPDGASGEPELSVFLVRASNVL